MDFEKRLNILAARQRRLTEAIAELRADVQAIKPKSQQVPGGLLDGVSGQGVDVKQILHDLRRQTEEWKREQGDAGQQQ